MQPRNIWVNAVIAAALGITALSYGPTAPDVEEASIESSIPEPPELDLP